MSETEVHVETETVEPVNVRVISEPSEKHAPSDLATWQTYVLTGLEAAFRLLSQDSKRHRAVITVTGNAASVMLCRPSGVANGIGGQLSGGQQLIYESASAVYCVPQGAPITVMVLEERYL